MLGFKDGVKYTVEETQAVFKEAFGPGGIYSTAADDFSKTFAGTLSMIGDTYRKFQETVSGAFFDELKTQFGDLDTFLKNNMDTITKLGEQLGAGFVMALKAAGTTVKFLSDNVKILTATFITLAVAKITHSFLLLTIQLGKAKTAMALFNIVVGKNPFVKLLSVVLGLGTALYAFKDSIFPALKAEKALQKQTEKTTKALEFLKKESRDHYKQQIHDQKQAALAIKKEAEAWDEAYNLRRIEESHNAMHDMMNTVIEDTEVAKASWRDYTDGIQGALLTQEKAMAELKTAGENAYNGLTDAVTDFVMTGKFNFKDFANSVIRDLVRIAVQAAITWGIKKAAGTFLGIPFLAEGGPLKAGQPAIVGEEGPELFVPDRAGTVVPSGAPTGAAIGGEVTVNFNISTVDADSFDDLLLSRKGLIIGTIQQAFRQQGRRFA